VAPWPREDGWYRIAAVSRAHRLAIVRDDLEWLRELDACWDAMSLDAFASQLRAKGEIGFGLSPAGLHPVGWTPAEVAILIDNDVMREDVFSDQAWIALAAGDLVTARFALTEYENFLAGFDRKWIGAPVRGVSEGLANPDIVLQIERRALSALLDRAGRDARRC
jgi:hypothetical protein